MTRIRVGRTATAFPASLLAFALGAGGLLSGQSAPADWSVDVARSCLTVKVLPAGLLASTLHTHFFQPETWSGEIAWDSGHPERVRVAVRIAADSLRDHQPKLSARDAAKVERQVRGAAILDAERFREIRFEAGRLEVEEIPPGGPDEFRGKLAGTLTLHGRSRPLELPIRGRVLGDRLDANTEVTFKQSDFGIQPYSTALGAIAVRDEVSIEIALVAVPRR